MKPWIKSDKRGIINGDSDTGALEVSMKEFHDDHLGQGRTEEQLASQSVTGSLSGVVLMVVIAVFLIVYGLDHIFPFMGRITG